MRVEFILSLSFLQYDTIHFNIKILMVSNRDVYLFWLPFDKEFNHFYHFATYGSRNCTRTLIIIHILKSWANKYQTS